jgi:transcriptional regulator with XRE-family HTH domain
MKNSTEFLQRANRLRLLRFQCNLSKAELSEHTGFSPKTISQWELGLWGGITVSETYELLQSLKSTIICSFDWIWYGKGFNPYILK